jgi:peroxiredoxin
MAEGETPPDVGDRAPDLRLQDEGDGARLSEYWHEGPAILVFVRHFG